MNFPQQFIDASRREGIVVMAGAGVSAAPPSALPGWYPLNKAIFDAVCNRVEAVFDAPGYVAQLRDAINSRREAQQFPPDYQAQVLAERCGADYFRALRAVDIAAFNAGHAGIAALANHGIVKAVVTTNFDRLIERALEEEGVGFEVAYDPAGFARCLEALDVETAPLQVLKIHGCVTDHLSMIDTLKQRLLGRNEALMQCLGKLLARYWWLYLGFSAADLEGDPDYLGIVPAAAGSPGLVYVQWPGAKKLGAGAALLVDAYAGKASVVVQETGEVLKSVGSACGFHLAASQPEKKAEKKAETAALVADALAAWTAGMSPVNNVLCLAGVFEANGQTEQAFQVLHRFWNMRTNKLMYEDPNYDRFRRMHGRLGMGTGIMSLAEDLGSNRGMESIQNLLRIAEGEYRAHAWAGMAWGWAGEIPKAWQALALAERVFTDETATDEVRVDVWLALAELMYLTGEASPLLEQWQAVHAAAARAGDLPRQGRAAAFVMLMLTEFYPDHYLAFNETLAPQVFQPAARLHDPAIEGFQLLARGRMANRQRASEFARDALVDGVQHLERAGRYPWCTLGLIEAAKSHLDLQQFEAAAALLNQANEVIGRHPVLVPWHREALCQYHLLVGAPDAALAAITEAIERAAQMGLQRRADALRGYLDAI